jgi:hypothetical protein
MKNIENILKLEFFVDKEKCFAFITESCYVNIHKDFSFKAL